MSHLASWKGWYVIKAAGDNGIGQDEKVHLFVVENRAFPSKAAAVKVARKLAQETPGNRYYVVEDVVGYMAPVAPLKSVCYAGDGQ